MDDLRFVFVVLKFMICFSLVFWVESSFLPFVFSQYDDCEFTAVEEQDSDEFGSTSVNEINELCERSLRALLIFFLCFIFLIMAAYAFYSYQEWKRERCFKERYLIETPLSELVADELSVMESVKAPEEDEVIELLIKKYGG